ncbi:hypothetical protein O181_075679 [Austropuccinia psidii MF-1]|uniref:Integrase catalytic domain-containing protein n=1 Tax=Austropuccinia psidii MF-1 TaxID=1389203 RepID=A0A9Q3FB12_9BASI|nr:hypothetical protein [Austropuccinia psidii MF-1]
MVFPIVTKAEGPNVLQWWIEFWTVQVRCAPRALWTDKEREFTSLSFSKYLANRGILFVPTLPYSPQKNGKAKCLNQTLGDMERAMTTSCQVPHKFWHLAYISAGFIHNRLPNSRCKMSPYKMLFGR